MQVREFLPLLYYIFFFSFFRTHLAPVVVILRSRGSLHKRLDAFIDKIRQTGNSKSL
jgi:hypothetical protein